jgi:type IV secretory pathway VirB2 component (pilin)
MHAILHDPMQLFSFAGALMILIAYAGHQSGRMNPRSHTYNLLNAIGSSILGYVALFPFKLGFVVLEFTWLLISIWAMFRRSAQQS